MKSPSLRTSCIWLALLLSLPVTAFAGHGHRHHSRLMSVEQDWDVVCGAAMDKRCVAYTEVEGIVAGVWGVAHALSVSANEPGGYRVGWDPRFYVPDGVHPLRLRVDGRYRRSISPGRRGYRGNEIDGYRIETRAELINAMKRGRELTINYIDVFGDEREVTFSLMGITDSLRFMDARLAPPVEAERKAVPPPPPEPRLYRHK